MKRSAPLKRSRKRIARRTRPRARSRTKGGRRSDPAKLDWLRSLPCVLGRHTPYPGSPFYRDARTIEVHHHRRRGARASDERTVPVCASHHRTGPLSIRALSARGFERLWQLDFDAECERYEARWQAQRVGVPA